MKLRAFNLLAGASLLTIAATAGQQTAFAQGASAGSLELEEIVVTARRKDESLQDVPTTINAVTGADIAKLNIRKFEDIASIVPGLTMASGQNGSGATASVRGVNYDVNASGNNGTVEFYMNDAPISAGNLFQTVYDIQQIELLRGPQGTLRGRASPSGSMTVTTHRPDLQEMGGYVSGTGTNIGGYNGQGAFSYPIITDMLAVRVAAAYDKNEGNRVHSVNNPEDPYSKSKSGRLTVRFEPTDSLSFVLTGQKTKQDALSFDLLESQQNAYPNNPVNLQAGSGGANPFVPSVTPPFLTATSRLTIADVPRTLALSFSNYNLQGQWAFLGQKLNYVGARNEQHLVSFAPSDLGDYFSPSANPVYQGYGPTSNTHSWATAHELRLSNEERVAGMFDYVVGFFTQQQNVPTTLTSTTAVATSPVVSPATQFVNFTPVQRLGGNLETSEFINLTAHVGDALEISGGMRHIKYSSHGELLVSGAIQPDAHEDSTWTTNIYSGSVKYNFTENFMVYTSVGTSWRPGIAAVGDFSLGRSALENSFLKEEPEKSTSYEIGFKSSGLDKRLRTNMSFYHQKFTNYPYRSTGGVWYIETFFNRALATPAPDLRANIFNFVAAVPVEVNGLEAQLDFSATSNWDVGGTVAVSKGEIKSGFIPCTDLNRDGIPDAPGVTPTLLQLQNAVGGVGTVATQPGIGTISGCTVTQNASSAPQVSGSLQSEYRLPINSALSSFVRGQASLYGNSKNDPLNPVDDVSRYALLNLFLGVRDPAGVWEVSVYGKNVTNTEKRLTRAGSVYTVPFNSGRASSNFLGGDQTQGLVLTAPREFGVNLRYAFGAK